MRFERQVRVASVCLMAAAINSCKKDVTAPEAHLRTHSVITSAQVPANPTAPLTLRTNDPESQVQMTLSVEAQQAIVRAAGGAATIKLTDLAPRDYTSLSVYERSQLGNPNEFLVLAIDVNRTTGAALALAGASERVSLSASWRAQTAGSQQVQKHTMKVKNQSGRRCTPGKVVFVQIQEFQSLLREHTLIIDDDFPIQNITGDAFVANELLHYIMCWECPRVVPTTGAGR